MGIQWILFGLLAVASYGVSAMLQSKFKKYSQVPIDGGLTGKDIAEKMLKDNGINDVKVISTSGSLTDHYNPVNKTVNLSEPVYGNCSVAAAAVAAHECGHAVQHAYGYGPLKMRSSLVPVVSFASKWVTWVILGGIVLLDIFPSLIWVGIGLFALTTLFSFVTLPVELNASSRALTWLETGGVTNNHNHAGAKDALKWAAYTYVVAALGSLATLFYYVMLAFGNRR